MTWLRDNNTHLNKDPQRVSGSSQQPIVTRESLCVGFGSGVFDKNGKEILDGSEVEITINSHYGGRPHKSKATVRFIRGAFRFISDRHGEGSTIGDLSYNCEVEVLNA